MVTPAFKSNGLMAMKQIGLPTANGKLDLTMIFVPESVAQIMNRPKEATGFAVSNDGRGCRRAYIFVERVAQQAVDRS